MLRLWRAQYPAHKARLTHLNETIGNFVIGSYAPPKPWLTAHSNILSIGSCFAEELTRGLQRRGISVGSFFMSERWSTAFALHHLFAHLISGTPFPPGYAPNESIFANVATDLIAKLQTADLFVLTLGLSCCWFNRDTGEMVLEPKDGHSQEGQFNSLDRFEMRQTTAADNEACIHEVIRLIRSVNPHCAIVLTLSPIPLQAAMTVTPSVPTNLISKAVLRSALHNIESQKLQNVFYWPSYDFVTWYGSNVEILFGTGDNDMRHLDQTVIDRVIALFLEFYFEPLSEAVA
jgi:hypothetical protein